MATLLICRPATTGAYDAVRMSQQPQFDCGLPTSRSLSLLRHLHLPLLSPLLCVQAECLQGWADLQREVLQQAPDEVLAQPGHVQQVQQAVLEAYRAALEAYKQVCTA